MSPATPPNIDLDGLPTPPTVAAKLLETIEQDDVDTNEIIKIIAADPGLSAKLVEYCNSPLMRRKHEISSLRQAVLTIGLKKLKLLALSFSLMKPQEGSNFDFEKFWTQSLANALSCALLSEHLEGSSDEEFLLALVLNIGQIGLAKQFPNLYSDYLLVNPNGQRLVDADAVFTQELARFGFNRFQVGAMILRKWRFPQSMCDAIEGLAHSEQRESNRAMMLIFSQELATTLYADDITQERIDEMTVTADERLGIDPEAFLDIVTELRNQWAEYSSLLGLDLTCEYSLEALEKRARDTMLNISLEIESELEEAHEINTQLQVESQVDSLTKLLNRRAFDTEASTELKGACTRNASFGFVILDIDHFKSVNDTYGHSAGDAVLSAVGECLASSVRATDKTYRLGGEEFAVLLLGCGQEQTKIAAERLRESINRLKVKIGEGMYLSVTASVGVSWSKDAQGRDIDAFFEKADELLYKAKKRGRNQCAFEFESELNQMLG